MKYYNSPKKPRPMSVYIVLALCLVAVGIGAKALLNAVSDTASNSSNSTSNTTSVADNVNNIISNITYSDLSSKTSSTQQESSQTPTQTDQEYPANNTVSDQPKPIVANYFVLPVTGNIIKSYSDTQLMYSATFNDMRLHPGIDIAADANTAVKSAGDGVVKEIKTDDLLGITIVIDHGNGVLAYYSGLNTDPLVIEGDRVYAGTPIGSLGTVPSESLDQSHLHLEFTKDSKPVSPLKIMGMEE